MDIAGRYAEYATQLKYEDLPAEVVDHAKKLILDIIANSIGGHEWMAAGPKIVEGIRSLNRGQTGATVLATGEQMAPEWATLVNGGMAHGLDYDNHHAKGVIHSGSSMVNVALAAGEENNASGKELITAVVVGYEIANRLAMGLGPHSSHEIGSHPTGTCATFAGSAVIGRLRGTDADVIWNAMGLNGSQAAGSMQYVVNGAWNKRMHPGLATHSSFIAVSLAQAGFIGAGEVFEGEQGFFQGYAKRPTPERALEGLGTEYETMNQAIKPYSLCRYTHQTLELLIGLANEGLDSSDVAHIQVDIPTYGLQLVGTPIEAKRNPTSAVDAQFSAPFGAALALTEKRAGMDIFTKVLADGFSDEFKRIMSVTDVKQADDLDAIHPEFWPGRVTVQTQGGETIERYAKHMRGEKEIPMSFQEVADKLTELSPNHSEATRAAVVEAAADLENRTVADLLGPLRK